MRRHHQSVRLLPVADTASDHCAVTNRPGVPVYFHLANYQTEIAFDGLNDAAAWLAHLEAMLHEALVDRLTDGGELNISDPNRQAAKLIEVASVEAEMLDELAEVEAEARAS